MQLPQQPVIGLVETRHTWHTRPSQHCDADLIDHSFVEPSQNSTTVKIAPARTTVTKIGAALPETQRPHKISGRGEPNNYRRPSRNSQIPTSNSEQQIAGATCYGEKPNH